MGRDSKLDDDLISVDDVTRDNNRSSKYIFKIMYRLGVGSQKIRSMSPLHRGQRIAYVTHADHQRIKEELSVPEKVGRAILDQEKRREDDFVSAEIGVFYLIQLERDHDPGRFKVGFSATISERRRQLRTSAPFAEVVNTWPCRRLWEKTAINCVSAGCEKLHTEVF